MTARFVAFPALQLVSALAGLCLSLACSSEPANPGGGGAGQSAGGASGGSTPSSGGSTSGGASGGSTPTFGGSTSGGATSGGMTALGGSTQSGGASGSVGTSGAAGAVSSGGVAGQGGAGNAGKGGGGTGGSSAGSGGTSGAAGGGGASAGGSAGAAGSAGKSGSGGSAGSAGSAGAAGSGGGGTYNPCPTSGNPCKVIPMGDSITVGIGTGVTGGGYRVELFKQATAASKKLTFDGVATSACSISAPSNPPSGFVNKHSACSGWTIQQIAGMVSDSVALKPDIILLHAGTNDTGSASGAPGRLGSLLDQIFTADSHVLVVVARLVPFPAQDAAITSINNGIATQVQMRATAGKHIMLVDMHTGYPDNSMPDGIHPNQSGYVWMANVWYKAIGPLLP